MTARVINDPSALGWEYDPDTGRWTWGGHSSSGGGGGGGIGEAPVDGDQYGRQNAGWTKIQFTGDGADLSDYVNSMERNDVLEGTFQLVWDDSSDPTFPFNGRLGYNKNEPDPNAMDGSFLYVQGTRGKFSIGRDGDVELHGASEIQGIPNTNDERPWITGFSYVQAEDFLDANGDSIIGSGGGGGTVTTADVQLTNPTAFMPEGMATQEDANAYIEGELQKIIPDANADGTIYGRKNNAWVAVPTGGGGGDVDLTGYATETWVSANYQVKGNYLTSFTESDPVFKASPAGSITQNDINNWNSSSGGGNPFPWSGAQAEFISSMNGSNIKITAGGSRGPEILFANTGGGTTSKSLRASGGNLEIVNAAYNNVVWSVSDAGVCTATDFVATSDRNKKDHIETAPTGVIERLRGVTFQWKDTGRESAGVIAQELQDAGLGHLVHENDDGLSVSYAGLTAYLIEEIKLLKAEIKALK